MTILIDNGHGIDTPGKRSPDGLLLEWRWTREVARSLAAKLGQEGFDARLLVPEQHDVALRQRVDRANAYGRDGAVLVSLHVNASGSDQAWRKPSGWCVAVAPRAGAMSKAIADELYDQAQALGLAMRSPGPGLKHWTMNLAICRDTVCPAVLTENLFMDNRSDCQWLLTQHGRDVIAQLHFNAIKNLLR